MYTLAPLQRISTCACAYFLCLYSLLLLCTMPAISSSCVHTFCVYIHVCYCARCLPCCLPVCILFESIPMFAIVYDACHFVFLSAYLLRQILMFVFVYEAYRVVFLSAYLLRLYSLLLLCTKPVILSFCVHTFCVYALCCFCVRCLPCCLSVCTPFEFILMFVIVYDACHFVFLC